MRKNAFGQSVVMISAGVRKLVSTLIVSCKEMGWRVQIN